MRLVTVALSLVVALPVVVAAQQPVTFVTMTDRDTLAVEQITRTPATLTGDLRLPQQDAHTHYVVHLRTDGMPDRVEVINDRANFFTGTIAFDATARLSARAAGGGLADHIVLAPPGSYPAIGTSMALIDQLLRTAHPAVGDSAILPVINIRNRNQATATIKRISADSIRVYCDGCMQRGVIEELRFAVAKDGSIIGGVNPNRHWSITRR